MRRKKKTKSLHKFKMFFAFLIFGGIITTLGYNLVNNIVTIGQMNLEKKELKTQISDLEKEKKELQTDIMKLEDPEYIAKYVREKYFYSKDDELILRIED